MTATIILAFIKRAWPYLLASALLAAGWWWYQAQLSNARAAGDAAGRAAVQQQWDAERASLAAAAAQAERQNQARKEAQNETVHTARDERAEAAQRERTALAGLAGERDRLRKSLDTALNTLRRCDVPGTTADASADRSAAVNAVFAEMESAGAEMARAAGGHAADSLMYQRAWPK